MATRSPLTREELLALLEASPAPHDLTGVDVTKVDLSSDTLEREREEFTQSEHRDPIWFSDVTGGINFADATLDNAHFDGGKVWRGDFERANLTCASFTRSDAGLCRFDDADLTNADLSASTLARASFRGATVRKTHLSDADLRDADFSGATLDHVYLAGATLANTRISRQQLVGRMGEVLDKQYELATSAYAGLKSNFRNLGRFEDASWAYMQERRMETKSFAPWRRKDKFVPRLKSGVRWIGGCISGLVVGYGERPLRAIAFVPVLVSVYALLYWILGDLTVDGHTAAGLGACFRNSLASFVTLSTSGTGEVKPRSPGAEIWTSLEAMSGVALIALVMFSLGKRITRS